jgi:hypothetical protein
MQQKMERENRPIEDTITENDNIISFEKQVNNILKIIFENKEFWGDSGKQGERQILTDLPPW